MLIINRELKETPKEEESSNQIEIETLLIFFNFLFSYSIIPLPDSFVIFINGIIFGFIASFLLIFFMPLSRNSNSMTSSSNRILVNREINKTIPSFHEIIKPFKVYMMTSQMMQVSYAHAQGWVNEIHSYSVENYHISNTHSTFITLDNSSIRLQTPAKFIFYFYFCLPLIGHFVAEISPVEASIMRKCRIQLLLCIRESTV